MSSVVYDERKEKVDRVAQGSVAVAAGIIFVSVLFLPWLTAESSAVSGLANPRDQAAVAIPMILILLGVVTIFGGAIHIAGYEVGIQLATVMSGIAFFISVMVIIVTLMGANSSGGVLSLLVGPWICAAGAIFGVISSRLERR